MGDPGFGGRGGGGRELSYTRALPLFEARSGEWGCDIKGGRWDREGASPSPVGKKMEIRKCVDDF